MMFFRLFLFASCLAGVSDATARFTQSQFTKKSSKKENLGSGFIRGFKVRSLPQCASLCTTFVNCNAFNFYQFCRNSENLEFNCKLYDGYKANLTTNPCCSYYTLVSETPNINERKVNMISELPSEEENITSVTRLETTSRADMSWADDSMRTTAEGFQEQTTASAFSPSQPPLIEEIQANSTNDLKPIFNSFIQYVPSVQCNKDVNPPVCMVKTANYSNANLFCKQYNNGKSELAVLSTDYFDNPSSAVVKNYTVCPPYCNFWIGLHGTAYPQVFPPFSIQFNWGPWIDNSKYEYNSWEPNYPKQTQGDHYAFKLSDTGRWGSEMNASKEMPFLCRFTW